MLTSLGLWWPWWNSISHHLAKPAIYINIQTGILVLILWFEHINPIKVHILGLAIIHLPVELSN